MCRFLILKEEIPDFTDPSSFMKIPLLRSSSDHIKPIPYQAQNRLAHALFDAADYSPGIATTHLGRGSAKRGMTNSGIPDVDIKRMCRMMRDAHSLNYLQEPPHNCIVQRAGGDPSTAGMKDFAPARSTVLVSDDLIFLLFPTMKQVSLYLYFLLSRYTTSANACILIHN